MGHETVIAVASELERAYATHLTTIVPPSARVSGFDLDAAYAVERELSRRRRAEGRGVVGRKVGYANKAVWRALKLETLVWADMYDDTVRYATRSEDGQSLGRMGAPRIEPEIVFRMRHTLPPGTVDPVSILEATEWIALGFEIIDCVYVDWTFQPADFVAAFGLHAALVVGEPLVVEPPLIPGLAAALPAFTVALHRNGERLAEGSGRHSLRSPALCVGELATAISRRPGAEPLAAGELVSTGTLTDARAIAAGDTWSAVLDGLALPALTLHMTL